MAPEFMDPHRASQAVDVWAVGVMCAEWLLEEQMGREEAALLKRLWNGSNGKAAVHARLREAVAASGSPKSLLEQVASAALDPFATGRPSSIDLTATATVTAEGKRASFTRWMGQVGHVLRDCVSDVADEADRRLITSFLSRIEPVCEATTQIQELTAIAEALTFGQQNSPLLLRVARNIIQSLLEYSTTPEPDPMLLRYLAQVYVDTSGTLNRLRAVALLDRATAIIEAARGADCDEIAALLHQKAGALVDMGGTANLTTAVQVLDRAINIVTRASGPDHPDTAATLHAKANALVQMGGSANLAAAVALYDRVIEINTAALWVDHLETATTLHEKAHALVQMGGSANLAAAVALYDRVALSRSGRPSAGSGSPRDRVIDIDTAALGADHLETANTLHAKANALVQMGGSANLAAAVALYDRVIEIFTAALGADHPSTATTLHEQRQSRCMTASSRSTRQRWERITHRQPPRCTRRRMRWCGWEGRPTSQRQSRCMTASSRSTRQRWERITFGQQ
jgi:deoxycytidylate deaminase